MPITLNNITSGYNLAAINANFQSIQSYINSVLLARAETGVAGEALMTRDLDMNHYRILNADLDGSSITNDRAVRVSDMFLSPIPQADVDRRGKIVTFDINTGQPVAIAPASGSAVDVLNQLAANDGLKLIGMCPTIAVLRTIEPSTNGQRITVKEYASGTGYGGGQFRAVLASALVDNGGTIIKTTGGNAWLRLNADVVNPLMFGAVPRVDDTTPSAHTAITNAHRAATGKMEGLGYTYNITGETLLDSSSPKINEDLRLYSIASANVANIIRVQNAAHRLSKIIIYGNSTPLAIGITHSDTAASAVIENCTIFDCGRNGILAAGYGVKIRNNRTVNCGYAGTGNFRCSIQINEAEHSLIEGNECRECVWGILIRNEIGVTQGFFNAMRNNIVISKSGNVADAQGVSASAQFHLTTTGNIVRNFPNNAIDHQNCFGMIISDNQIASCNDGIFIGDRSCGRILITNNNIEGCITGVRFYNPAGTAFPGNTFADVSISGNSIFQSTTYGIWVPMDGESSSNWVIAVDNNLVEGQGAGGRGIRMSSVTFGSCSGNVVRRVAQHGIDLSSCDNLRVVNNTILDAGFGTSSTYNGINAATCSRLTLTGNSATGASMVYAVNVSGGSQNIIDAIISRSLSGATAVNVSSSTGTLTGTLLIKG